MSRQVLRVEADDLRAVESVSAGDVAVAVGLTHAATGDTLVCPSGGLRGLQLDGVTVPPPVFSLAVEAESLGQQVWRVSGGALGNIDEDRSRVIFHGRFDQHSRSETCDTWASAGLREPKIMRGTLCMFSQIAFEAVKITRRTPSVCVLRLHSKRRWRTW